MCLGSSHQVLLGTVLHDYCDRFIDAIRPRQRRVKFEDGSSAPIFHRLLKSASQKRVLLPAAQNPPPASWESINVRVISLIWILTGTQVMVAVNSRQHGVRVAQPLPSLYEKRQLAAANGIVQVTPDATFHLMVAILSKYSQYLVKNKIICSVTPYTLLMIPIKMAMAEVPGFFKDDSTTKGIGARYPGWRMSSRTDEWETSPEKGMRVREASERESRTPTTLDVVDSLNAPEDRDLGNVPGSHHERLRNMLWELTTMLGGSLEEITAIGQRTDLLRDARPVAQHPSRAGPKTRGEEQLQAEKMLRAGLIEAASSLSEYPVILALKA